MVTQVCYCTFLTIRLYLGREVKMSGHRLRFAAVVLVSCFFFSCMVKTSRNQAGESRLAKIHDIRIAEGRNKTIIEIEADEPLLYTSFRLSNPDRLVIEMAEVALGEFDHEVQIKEGPIRSLRPSPSGESDVTRLEFELSGSVKTDIRPDGLSIVVEATQQGKPSGRGQFAFFKDEPKSLPKTGKNTSPQTSFPKASVSPKASPGIAPPPSSGVPPSSLKAVVPAKPRKPRAGQKPGGQDRPAAPQKKVLAEKKPISLPPAKELLSIRFEQAEGLQLVLRADGKLSPRIFYSNRTKKHLVIDLPGVHSSRGYKPLSGDGLLVKQVRFGRHPRKLRVVLDFKRRVEYSSEQIQKELKIRLRNLP